MLPGIAQGPQPAPRGVLMVLTGGPGQPGVPSVARLAGRRGPALRGYRLVMFDQRGTGAGALNCPALQRQMGASDLAVPSPAAVRSCAAAIGHPAALDALITRVHEDEAATAGQLSQGLHASTLCADMRMPWGGPDTPLTERRAALARSVARLTTAQVWPFDRATAAGNGIIQTCLYWPPTTPAPPPARGVRWRWPAGSGEGEQMTAYVIADIDVHDQEAYREYSALVPDTLQPHGGRFLVRGGAFEKLEGDWQPRRVVVLEFPSADHARRWYGSPEYVAAMAKRQRASTGNLVLVEGTA